MKYVLFAAALALCGVGAVAQTSVDLSIDQARNVATQALVSGEPALAVQIAEAILAQLPDDRTALIVIAAAAPRAGDPAKGRVAGARAWRVSSSDAQRYEAARLTALAAANEERFTLSTFWLRRALTVAPNEEERTQTLRDARVVSQRNPWSTQLSFSLVPSSNVNGGAEDEDLIIGGNDTGGNISEDGLALSGWRASLGFGTQYRFQENAQSRSTVGLSYQISRVRITEDTTVPDEAFDTSFYSLSIRHDRALENGTLSFRGARGLYEYRDLDLATETTEYDKYDIWRLGVDRRFVVNDQTLLSVSADRERLSYLKPSIGDVNRISLTGAITYQLDSGNRITTTLKLTDSDGDTPNYTSDEQSLSITYGFGEPLGPISLSVGGGLRWSTYPDYLVFDPSVFGFVEVDGGRQDETVFANANIGFPDISYAGFTPGLRIDVSTTDSNVSRFDRNTFSAGFTISSQF
ncbi:surface lipoprotein assembly modifier [Yoonia sp. GPGPB17]|uniref:surface lipoprotein assembly modifier n=1 Tax=Yoonia sp. GPGPB17 TaxID=3026147 RepID=UPI0030BB6AF4